MHPVQVKTPKSILNNAIGNVFAMAKRKEAYGQPESYELNGDDEDENEEAEEEEENDDANEDTEE